MSQSLTRKEFITSAAKYAAGISAGVAGLSLLSAEKTRAGAEEFTWPWPYQKLDPEHVRVLGHDSFWEKACSYAAFKAIIHALAEKVGEPFTLIPPEIMIYGHGGAAGWGTICGALNGASAAICLVADKETSDKLINELIGWYTQTEFPTDKSNEYAVNHVFADQRYDQALPKSVCGSPLCHPSVTEWCIASGFKVSDIARKERCARLAGDVAAYAVELLNQHFDSVFTPIYVPPESIAACMSCHGASFQNNVAAKMECMQCHGDPHVTSAVEQMPGMPASFSLEQNFPNPFNPGTSIQFSIANSEKVDLAIYDIRGRLVRTLIDHELYSPGYYTVSWDGTDNHGQRVASGVYFTKMQAGKYVATRKMSMVK
jgi:hypothetical protein